MTVGDEAALYQRGLEARYLTAADAVAWADRLILALPEPPVALLDVSLAGHAPPADVAALLRPLTEGVAADRLVREQVQMMRAVLATHPERAEQVAWAARDFALPGVLPDGVADVGLLSIAYQFDPEERTADFTEREATEWLSELLAHLEAALRDVA